MPGFTRTVMVVAAMCAACGGGDESAIDKLTSDLSAQQCSKLFECKDTFPTDRGYTFEQAFGTSTAMCEAQYESLYNADTIEA